MFCAQSVKLLAFLGDMVMGRILSTHTEKKIIELLRRLPPQQLEEVIQFIDFIAERRGRSTAPSETSDPKRSIMALRGRGKGERLVERLLQSRQEDQRRDDRK